ncbi:Arm DNA-binding domain-containing protein [Sphingobium sp. SA916]|uniref:Arm DNA-binding domain-containing protein n=1 Tax=Sphingobium sp. SA916 TaxID=1851207 RepID=UPI000C9F194C
MSFAEAHGSDALCWQKCWLKQSFSARSNPSSGVAPVLTDEIIQALGSTVRFVKRSDGGGLYISITPGGTARWYLTYRYLGEQKAISGGRYPDVSLEAVMNLRRARQPV